MDMKNTKNEELFTLNNDLNSDLEIDVEHLKNSLTNLKKVICKKLTRVTELQEEISAHEKEILTDMAKKERLKKILAAALNE